MFYYGSWHITLSPSTTVPSDQIPNETVPPPPPPKHRPSLIGNAKTSTLNLFALYQPNVETFSS